MRVRLLAFFLLWGSVEMGAWAQTATTEAQVRARFLHYLASQNGAHNRIDKTILPWRLSEIYLNDSLLAKVNLSDQSRILARTGWYGAGPLLRADYKLSRQDFEKLKARVRQQDKFEWTPEDFPDSVMVLQQLNLVPASHYAYSYPLVLADKKLVLVKREFRAEKSGSRWSCLEVYRILASGGFRMENCYLRVDK